MQGPGNSGTEDRIPFVLALVGGIFAAMNALFTGVMLLFLGSFLPFAEIPMPMGFFGLLFGWLLVSNVIAAFALIMGAVQLYREPHASRGGTWALVGGCIAVLSGNLVAAALGIVAGVMVLSRSGALRAK